MQVFNSPNYTDTLKHHYETYFGKTGKQLKLDYGPTEKLHSDFYILEVTPNDRHSMFCYCTVGMSADRIDDNLIELVLYSPRPDNKSMQPFLWKYHPSHLRIRPGNSLII